MPRTGWAPRPPRPRPSLARAWLRPLVAGGTHGCGWGAGKALPVGDCGANGLAYPAPAPPHPPQLPFLRRALGDIGNLVGGFNQKVNVGKDALAEAKGAAGQVSLPQGVCVAPWAIVCTQEAAGGPAQAAGGHADTGSWEQTPPLPHLLPLAGKSHWRPHPPCSSAARGDRHGQRPGERSLNSPAGWAPARALPCGGGGRCPLISYLMTPTPVRTPLQADGSWGAKPRNGLRARDARLPERIHDRVEHDRVGPAAAREHALKGS